MSRGWRQAIDTGIYQSKPYIFGAVYHDREVGWALVLFECHSGMMQLRLDEISTTVREDYYAIILMDRASWHTTESLNIPKNIHLLPLPPYSPELNPMEQLWQKQKLKNMAIKHYIERLREYR